MKNTYAWGWLAAGVLALGLNGIYQDGGAAWVHRAMEQGVARMAESSGAVIALAAGRADWFVAHAQTALARNETASCRFGVLAARLHAKMARAQGGMARFEAMSAREEARLARWEANRARVEAQVERVRYVPADFNIGSVSVVRPRVNVRIPRIRVPQIPEIRIPEVHVEVAGLGPAE